MTNTVECVMGCGAQANLFNKRTWTYRCPRCKAYFSIEPKENGENKG